MCVYVFRCVPVNTCFCTFIVHMYVSTSVLSFSTCCNGVCVCVCVCVCMCVCVCVF